MSKGSNRTNRLTLTLSIVAIIAVTAGNGSAKAQEYSLTIGGEQVHFVARPELGYVVKASRDESEILPSDGILKEIQSDRVGQLNVARRPDISIILDEKPPVQTERAIGLLGQQSAPGYIAPLFSLDGETVAIIPEIIVRLEHATDSEILYDLCQGLGCTILRNLLYTEQEYLISPTARNAEDVLATVEALDSAELVDWAFPNIAFQPELYGQPIPDEPNRIEPDDVYFGNQWHLEVIRAPEAWSYANTTGDPNIVVAVLDSGVEVNHPDLADNIWVNPYEIPDDGIDNDGNGKTDDVHGWDFVNDASDVNPGSAHGTACAGLIAAQGNNNLGVTGVTWDCKIMPIRIAIRKDFITDAETATAMRYAAVSGADVLSNSWGGPKKQPSTRSAIEEITRLGGMGRDGKGCIVLFASGNDGGSVERPGAYPEAIAVGAVDQNDVVWDYSCHGPELDIVAPSGDTDNKGNLWTTDISGPEGYSNMNVHDRTIEDYARRFGGTSGACPIVAGVSALILSVNPNLTSIEVQRILLRSARDLGPSGWDKDYGFGCVDARAAVALAINPPGSVFYVDDDALDDPGPRDPNISDPNEDGSLSHPFDAIQEGINNSVAGETVIVLSGTYTGSGNRAINFWGKAITVRSEDGPESCVVDCERLARGFIFSSGEGADSILEGLRIINATYELSGGGIVCSGKSSPTIVNCVLKDNSALGGGGMDVGEQCQPTLINCIFSGNSAGSIGGGLCDNNHGKNTRITNCIFSGNSAKKGAAIFLQGGALLDNCTFYGNRAEIGGGGLHMNFGTAALTDCIFWGNSPEQISGNAITASYSNIQGEFAGESNMDIHPLFADPGHWDPNGTPDYPDDDLWVEGDYHLRSETGRWDPIIAGWVRDGATSPCIDAGDPNSDWTSEVWPHGGRINMGTYGGTAKASLSAEPQGMSLPRVAYIHHDEVEVAEGYQSLLVAHGCPTTLVPWQEVATTALDAYDLIMVGADTGFANAWAHEQNLAAVESSGKPVVGLSEGGYRYFGKLALSIGQPHGAHENGSAIEPVDPNHPLFSEPYPIEIPQDGVLELCTETDVITIYLWPAAPDTVTTLGLDAGNAGYYPLVLEHDRYLFWGFDTTADSLTDAGRKLLVNTVIRTANAAWATQGN